MQLNSVSQSESNLKVCPPSRRGQTTHFEIPCITIQKVLIGDHLTYVVRDDLLPGGTKQRGVLDLVECYRQEGYTEFVYASPFCGYAQIALAHACLKIGVKCTLFCGEDSTQKTPLAPHPFTVQAAQYGAEVKIVGSLEEATNQSTHYATSIATARLVPLGFDCDEFYGFYSQAIKAEWNYLVESVGFVPKTIWLPIGSGTLVRTFLKILPVETKIAAVNVQVLKPEDPRIAGLKGRANVQIYDSTLAFCQKESDLPSFPSNVHYDAKLFSFIKKFGQSQNVWWNVAR